MLLPIGRVDGCVLNGVAAVDHDPITDVNADVGHTGGVIRPDEKDKITGLCIRLFVYYGWAHTKDRVLWLPAQILSCTLQAD